MTQPIPRDENGIAHVVALSGGKDSTAMALWLKENEPRPYCYVCTPTGDESPEMFAHWRNISALLGAPLMPIVAGTLNSIIADQNAIPNFRMRFCTRLLKIVPFKGFLLTACPAVAYVGLRADEDDREGIDYGGNVQLAAPDGVTQRYPLREIGWGVADVLRFLAERGVVIPARTDCEKCFFQRLGEWYLLWRDRREKYMEAIEDERRYGYTYRSDQRDSWPASLESLAILFRFGAVPEISLRMMEKRKGMCRTCTL